MAKKIITIAGIQYEVDDADPNYKKRITPEPSLKQDVKQAWDKTKEIAKYIASPEFLKYLVPGVNTVAFAKDADQNVKEAFQHLKAGEYRQAGADTSYAIGNILSGVASLAPFVGHVLKPRAASQFKVEITKSPNPSLDLTKPGPKPPVTFTGEELLDQGKTRLRRTLNDAEYREALQKAFPKTWEEHLNSQLKELNKAKLDLTLLPDEPNIMQTNRPNFKLPGGYQCSASELESLLRTQYPQFNPADVLKAWGVPDDFINQFVHGKPFILVNDDVVAAIGNQTKLNQEQMRKLFFHEGGHATGVTANVGQTNHITQHNRQFSVKPKTTNVAPYYLEEDEIRARAMSLRRLHQTTGDSYETILNNWSSGKYRPDPNIDDLIQYYDRESLLSYLNNFLKDGGKINYFEYFQ